MKTNEQYFSDWETTAFGFGYGTGEEHVMQALKSFMECIQDSKYDYQDIEARIGPAVTWLLINALCRDDKITYGTSPRFGWLTQSGEELCNFILKNSLEQLCDALHQPYGYVECYKDHCNCDEPDCRKTNPFWEIK